MNNEVSKLENVRKSCKTTATVIKVLRIIMTVGMIICFAASILGYSMSKQINEAVAKNPDVIDHISTSVTVMGADISVPLDELAQDSNYGVYFGTACLIPGIMLLFVILIFKAIEKIFRNIEESDSPFTDEISKTAKKAFILVTIFVAITSGLGLGLFTGLVTWCIYTIFQYGNELQKQADETL